MNEFDVSAYLVNTGWIGASAQSGAKRISLPLTRKIIHKILDGSIDSVGFDEDIYFGFQIPKSLDDVESDILNPLNAWSDADLYNRSAKNLVRSLRKIIRNMILVMIR